MQKCFRTVDIDEVGKTARHLTFFEMLGNFSFGDYFKRDAIECAWDLVDPRGGFALDPSRLWASVYGGDEQIARRRGGGRAVAGAIGVPGERIVRLGGDNFWQAGPTGPCGPCSELYYDRGPEHGCGRPECAPGCDCDRFLEYWNLVFMQYDMLEPAASLEPLPAPASTRAAASSASPRCPQGVHSRVRDRRLRRRDQRGRGAGRGARYGATTADDQGAARAGRPRPRA